jgi:hypothetical protein
MSQPFAQRKIDVTISSNQRLKAKSSVPCFIIALLIVSLPLSAKAPAMPGGKMLRCSGLPCIELHIAGGKILTMLIDTGNVNSVLETSKATQLGLNLSPVTGADGKPVPGYSAATLTSVYAGDAPLGDIKVLVMDINADIDKGTFPKADGTLAYTALKDKLLGLDYVRRTIAVSPAPKEGLSCANRCGVISNPTFGKNGPPILATTGFTLNGRALPLADSRRASARRLI